MDTSNKNKYNNICELAKIDLITPATNAWPEIGVSALKRVKSHIQSTMKNNLLKSLLNISINGSSVNSPSARRLTSYQREYVMPMQMKQIRKYHKSSA